jgi:hypothetical protein
MERRRRAAPITPVADAADGLHQPANAAFGTTGSDRHWLYVTDYALHDVDVVFPSGRGDRPGADVVRTWRAVPGRKRPRDRRGGDELPRGLAAASYRVRRSEISPKTRNIMPTPSDSVLSSRSTGSNSIGTAATIQRMPRARRD